MLSFASLVRGQSAEYRRTLEEIVCQTMIDIINVPNDDKFQTIAEHALEELNFPTGYLGSHYKSAHCLIVFVQGTLNAGRSIKQKKIFRNASSMASKQN